MHQVILQDFKPQQPVPGGWGPCTQLSTPWPSSSSAKVSSCRRTGRRKHTDTRHAWSPQVAMDFAESEEVQKKATEVMYSLETVSSARRGETLGWFLVLFTKEILFPTTNTNYINNTLDSSQDCHHSILFFEIFDLLLHKVLHQL